MKPNRNRCSSCGLKWVDHYGIQPTCAALQTALTTLRQIADTARNRGARRRALSTVAFIENQEARSGSLHRLVRALLRYISRTPELLSLLYDLDLLPEQLKRDSFQWRQMLILTNWHHKTRRQRPNQVKL